MLRKATTALNRDETISPSVPDVAPGTGGRVGRSIAVVTTRLFLIRHGESEWNRLSRYAGQQDVSLSDLGKKQALRLAERLEHEPLSAIYSSPLQRARDTASAIAERQAVPVILEPRLAEIDHGLWQGLLACEVAAQFPAEHTRWHTEPHLVKMPQGESLTEVARRASQALFDILAKHRDGTVVLCSHDAVLRVLLLASLGLTLEHFWKWQFANASLSVLQVFNTGDSSSFQVASLNETTHLQALCSECSLQAL